MPVLRFPQPGCQRVCRQCLAMPYILCLGHLNHSQIVLPVHGSHEIDDAGAGEPAVTEHVFKLYRMLYATLYHLLHQFDLAHVALLLPAGNLGILTVCGPVLARGLPPVESIFGSLVLPAQGEVHQQLADTVRQTAEQPLVAPVAAARDMREYLADKLYGAACLDDVRVVKDEYNRQVALLMVTPYGDLLPKLAVDVVHDLAPSDPSIVEEVVEYILVAAGKPEKGRVCVVGWIGNAETGEQQKKLKHAQCRIEAVGLRLPETERTGIKLYSLHHAVNGVECIVFTTFLEKRGDF